jgi:small-conductance mechanosensitive channel
VSDLSIQGMLTTSGVVAIILGLVLQSTLGDVFSGTVLSFSRPHRLGDWINTDIGVEGRAVEMNWRATHILTGRRDLAILPNNNITKARIANVSSPSGVHSISITVRTDSKTPPAFWVGVLQRAALNSRSIVAAPGPIVSVKAIDNAGIEYDITFFVEELAASTRAQNELLDLICRHLTAAGIDLSSPTDMCW